MKILIVGSGGREHALAWKIAQSPLATDIFCAPGNAGMSQIGECVDLSPVNPYEILEFARYKDIDLTVIGPEAPLIDGTADFLRQSSVSTFGSGKDASQLEGSKIFARLLNRKYHIPHPLFREFYDPQKARDYVKILYDEGPRNCDFVIKADGQALGKGVFICDALEQALDAIQKIMVDGTVSPWQ